MEDTVLSKCERLDAKLSDIDAVLDMVSVAMASPEASLHMAQTMRLIGMSRRMVQRCRDLNKVEGKSH
ncbi:hypothetical protein HV192_29965 (plasmid) [Klebsiella oxytoca]|nr:hypothetical protein C2U44_31075 [Klebsiella oxytoca]ELS5458881.1 hypothetical protein [Raoultella ornithinolytica]EME8857490.1 hypothetical protein [Klebsiella aerogenes]KMI89739.1 hypothetical protein SN01_05432 [Klebsiella pneumoniae]MBS6112385.1 hypothetical protein [Citrobacter freundii]TXV69476.1 hypothetical protein D4M73_25030 [Klebsiella quasipneumoniae]